MSNLLKDNSKLISQWNYEKNGNKTILLIYNLIINDII